MVGHHPEAPYLELEPTAVIVGVPVELVPVPFAIYQVEIPR